MSALTDSTNINIVNKDDIEKVSSPQKTETIIPEKATVAAADSTTVAEEGDTSENVPVEVNITADKNAEMKETNATIASSVEVAAEEKSEEKKGDLVDATQASETTTKATTEATTETFANVSVETEKTSVEKMEDSPKEDTEDATVDTARKMEEASKVKTEEGSVDNIKEVSVEKIAESPVEKIEDAPSEKTEDASVADTVDKMDEASVNKSDVTPVTDIIDKNEDASVEKIAEPESAAETTVQVEVEISMEQEESLLSPEEIKKKISENLIAGRRFMKTDSFNQAVDVLSVSASLAAELHGEAHEETFEVNFLYGKALLEVARVEDGVLTNALSDIPKSAEGEDDTQDDVVENPEDVPQDERAEIKKNVEEALGVVPEEPETMDEESIVEEKEEAEVDEKAKAETEENADVDAEAGAETTAGVVEDVEMEDVEEDKAAEEQETAQSESSDSEDDDEPIKLAWEVLETCRCTCERKIKELEAMDTVDTEAVKTWKLNQADVLASLGEHGMIDSKYEQAHKDLLEAVAIQTDHLPATSRILANTTHLLAKAFSLDSLFNEAATHFNNSKNILIAKLEELKKQLESASEEERRDIESEIKELEGVIPDIETLVSDARASAQQTEEMKAAAKQELENAAAEINKISGEEVKDITNMVRRPTKRPASEKSADEVKKRKSEEGAETIPDEKAAAAPSEESESAAAPVTKE